MRRVVVEVERSGGWISADELRLGALKALEQGKDALIDVQKIEHLDASALQVLLALEIAQTKRGHQVKVENASQNLRQWFEYAGASGHFQIGGQDSNE